MKNRYTFLSIAILMMVALTGCFPNYSEKQTVIADRSWARCDLIQTAFIEQDALEPRWYAAAVKELRLCGMESYPEGAAIGRGKK